MLISFQGGVDEAAILKFRFKMFKIDDNRLGDRGCKHLSKAQWFNLSEIQLSNNFIDSDMNIITEKGCKYLSNAYWTKMKKIFICSQHLMKSII